MKIRTLLAVAALAASASTVLASTSASAWECPERYTQEYWLDTPAGPKRICTPYLSCETCFAVMP